MSTKSTGNDGEAIAKRFLEDKGYQIVATNWHCTGGEIDIVARIALMWVFVEVKTRRGGQAGDALIAITPAKRKRLITAAHVYASQTGVEDPSWRIDAIAVTLLRDGTFRCTHVEDALDW